jgi:16S rRNA (uracil1498-N3)-methyltransferase
MRCFYFPQPEYRCGDLLSLTDELKKHLCVVLRMVPGDKVELFNGYGQVATAVVKNTTMIELLEVRTCPKPQCSLTLIQGLPKGDKLELVLQKGTELGVNRFCLTPMERSVGQLKSARREKRLERWGKIIQEAARQCRQYHLPELTADSALSETLANVDADLKLLLWEESARPLHEVLSQYAPRRIAVIVGPEGGVSPQEAAQAEASGYQAVSLGPRILRTETAGLAIMAILQYLYGDLASGQHG